MAEYIERVAAIENACKGFNREFPNEPCEPAECHIQQRLFAIPAVDVVVVRYARFKWGYQNGRYGTWCTSCGAGWVDSENAEWIAREHDYCPKCGAKMDEKGEGE